MKTIKYIICKEDKYYVSQCLNVDISSFGSTVDDAKANLKEALDLYFEIVPAPKKEIPVGTLRSISRQAGIDISEFLNQ